MREEQIIQIIPAEGWLAKYKTEAGDLFERVICFALVESREPSEIQREIRAMEWADGYVGFCDESSNFSGLVYESNLPLKLT